MGRKKDPPQRLTEAQQSALSFGGEQADGELVRQNLHLAEEGGASSEILEAVEAVEAQRTLSLRLRLETGVEQLDVKASSTLDELVEIITSKYGACSILSGFPPRPLDTDVAGSVEEAGLAQEVLTVKLKPAAGKRKAKEPSGEGGQPTKKPAKPRAASGGTVKSEGNTPQEIATRFLNAANSESFGEKSFDMFTSAARVHAASKNNAQVQVLPMGKQGKQKVVVDFTGNNRKPYKETCPFYTREDLHSIIQAVVARQSSSSRRASAGSVKRFFSMEEISKRSPGIFWSFYHEFNGDVEGGAAELIGDDA